jgi:hypothetical protein
MMQNFSAKTLADRLEQQIRNHRLLDIPTSWQDEIIYPHYNGLSIYNAAQSIAKLFGLDAKKTLDTAIWDNDIVTTNINRVVLILTDGLGYKMLNQLIAEDDDLQSVIGDLTDGRGPLPITSTTPSTTATALPTLWTAKTPAEHGMLGTTLFLREFGLLANLLYYKANASPNPKGELSRWGLPAEEFVEAQAIGQLLAQVDVPTHLLLDRGLLGSGLSLIMHRGIDNRHIHTGGHDVWPRLHNLLAETAGQRCFVSAYWPAIDVLSHHYGAQSRFVHDEIKQQMTGIRNAILSDAAQDGQTLVIITADHGHYDVTQPTQITTNSPIWNAMRSTFGGDKRFAQLYLRNGYKQQVIDIIESQFADKLTWVDPETALKAGLFGNQPPHPEFFHRVGDLIIISRQDTCVYDQYNPRLPISMHGGLSDWEMIVPLLWRRI